MKNYYQQFRHEGEDGWVACSPMFSSRRKLGRFIYRMASNRFRMHAAKLWASMPLWDESPQQAFRKEMMLTTPPAKARKLKNRPRLKVFTFPESEYIEYLIDIKRERDLERKYNDL